MIKTAYSKLTNPQEKKMIPIIVKALKATDYDNPLTNAQLCKLLRKDGYNCAEPTMRKLIHFIRVENIIPCLIASQWGYWVEEEREYVDGYITMMQGRIREMRMVVKAMKVQASKMKR
jgi:hypothetical protein